MGVGQWVHSGYGLQFVDKKRKEREKRKVRQRKEGGGASSFPISVEKEETEVHRGRFRKGKREMSSLDTKISYKW